VFAQGNPFDHCAAFQTVLRIINQGTLEVPGFLEIADCHTSDDDHGKPNHWERELPVGEIYTRVFERPSPRHFSFGAGAQMAVTRECIESKPREWWDRLWYIFREYDDGFAFERLWARFLQDPI